MPNGISYFLKLSVSAKQICAGQLQAKISPAHEMNLNSSFPGPQEGSNCGCVPNRDRLRLISSAGGNPDWAVFWAVFPSAARIL